MTNETSKILFSTCKQIKVLHFSFVLRIFREVSLADLTRQIKFFLKKVPDAGVSPSLDLCCGDGKHLKALAKGSIALDYYKSPHLVLEDGKKFRQISLKDDLKDVLEEEGIVPSSVILTNTFEHTLEPHSFLMNIRRAMSDNSNLFLTIPVSHPILYEILRRFLPRSISSYWKGFLQHDHVNFFTCDTLDLTIQYAGFKIEHRYYGVNLPFFGWLSRLVSPTYGVICKKVPGWNYRDKPSVAKYLDNEERIRFKDSAQF